VTEVLYHWPLWARPPQLAPEGDWDNWLILAGRGFGKTRSGAEWVHQRIRGGVMRMALIARTAADIRDVMVEGESGILATAHPKWRPNYEPSKRRLTWPNGAIATTFSAEEPDSLRGPQYESAWADELAAWKYGPETWDQLQMVLRLGKRPQCVITTTPRPTPIIKSLVADRFDPLRGGGTVVTRGSTFDNKANLAPSFLRKLERKYAGTRLGRQELEAEILDDNPGALWKREWLDNLRVRSHPQMVRVVVAVDPAVSANASSAETGIIVAGLGKDGHGYVLEDRSLSDSPARWGAEVVTAFHTRKADRIVGEVNNGGDLVESNIRTIDRNVAYSAVRASRGKATRAEPVAALYEQGRVHHVGALPKLEDQLVDWDPTSGAPSPDRLDALVWALTELMLGEDWASPGPSKVVTGSGYSWGSSNGWG
jgi:phage terminase large subunit-like protein